MSNKLNNIRQRFTIKDLENISGVKAHTIRIWEKRYNLLIPKRTETNIRYYTIENLQKILNIVFLNNNDFKISKIAKMSEDELILHSRELALSAFVNDDAINSLKISMFQFDKSLFNATYSKLLQHKTFREIFNDIFVPFLDHIGLLWQTDTLLPAHEHFITNLISQKIQINTEKLQYNISNSTNNYVLFLPENEIHEIGLLYLNYELNLRGDHTIYLGQSLPFDNLKYFIENEKPFCFITSMTVMPFDAKIEEYFKIFDNALNTKKHKLIAIGQKTKLVKNHVFSSNIKVYDSVTELLKEI
ncbi:MerR family transcriptional regulator [Polaribacter sp. Z022]|uniref:MerR family transcriptional regulator n=1 Tax=Polaribacter sp. Z022 TaxID=2927125 RepID=UPI0020214781|nr:MerR family transcriptional regulator [Polaribacter sp. Z022]MCL7753366.1 MerR family transcriptional regulator [Polaribacter sp. Z022]